MEQRPIILSVTSGKGGVGKTLLCVNLAATLASEGKKVLVVDCDLGLANIDIMLGITPPFTLQDVIYGDKDLRDIIIPTKGGFDLAPASSGVRDMAQLLYEKIELIKSMISALSFYDVIMLDTGAGISEVVLQFNLLASRNVVIINKELTCLTDAYSMIKVIYQVFGREAFGIVVNPAADAKEADRLFSHVSTICEKFLGIRPIYLGHLLRDDAIVQSILIQEIAVLKASDSPIGKNCRGIARRLLAWKPATQTGA